MIGITEYSRQIQELSDDYFCRRISTDVYHARRKLILDELDATFNELPKEEMITSTVTDEE